MNIEIVDLPESERRYDDWSLIIEPSKQTGLGGLFLGNQTASEDLAYFKANNITVVLDVAGIKYKYPRGAVGYVKVIEADDVEEFQLIKYFEECIDYIHHHRKKGRKIGSAAHQTLLCRLSRSEATEGAVTYLRHGYA